MLFPTNAITVCKAKDSFHLVKRNMLLNFDNVFVESRTWPVRKKVEKQSKKSGKAQIKAFIPKAENVTKLAGLNLWGHCFGLFVAHGDDNERIF